MDAMGLTAGSPATARRAANLVPPRRSGPVDRAGQPGLVRGCLTCDTIACCEQL